MVNANLLAAAMMHMEGAFRVSSLAWRNNNPGNIMDDTHKLRTYNTKEEGYDALVEDILANRGSSLRNFITKYAPPTENATSLYIQVVCSITGYEPETLI